MSSLQASMHRPSQRPPVVGVVLGLFIVASVFAEWSLVGSKLQRLQIQFKHLEELAAVQQKDKADQLGNLEATSKALREDVDAQQTKTKAIETIAQQAEEQASKSSDELLKVSKQVSTTTEQLQKQGDLIDGIAKAWQKKLETMESTIMQNHRIAFDEVTKLLNDQQDKLEKLQKELQAERESLSSTLLQHQASVANLAEKQQSLENDVKVQSKHEWAEVPVAAASPQLTKGTSYESQTLASNTSSASVKTKKTGQDLKPEDEVHESQENDKLLEAGDGATTDTETAATGSKAATKPAPTLIKLAAGGKKARGRSNGPEIKMSGESDADNTTAESQNAKGDAKSAVFANLPGARSAPATTLSSSSNKEVPILVPKAAGGDKVEAVHASVADEFDTIELGSELPN